MNSIQSPMVKSQNKPANTRFSRAISSLSQSTRRLKSLNRVTPASADLLQVVTLIDHASETATLALALTSTQAMLPTTERSFFAEDEVLVAAAEYRGQLETMAEDWADRDAEDLIETQLHRQQAAADQQERDDQVTELGNILAQHTLRTVQPETVSEVMLSDELLLPRDADDVTRVAGLAYARLSNETLDWGRWSHYHHDRIGGAPGACWQALRALGLSALADSNQRHTTGDLHRFFTDDSYRQTVIGRISDREVAAVFGPSGWWSSLQPAQQRRHRHHMLSALDDVEFPKTRLGQALTILDQDQTNILRIRYGLDADDHARSLQRTAQLCRCSTQAIGEREQLAIYTLAQQPQPTREALFNLLDARAGGVILAQTIRAELTRQAQELERQAAERQIAKRQAVQYRSAQNICSHAPELILLICGFAIVIILALQWIGFGL
jgi:hypothetical protein